MGRPALLKPRPRQRTIPPRFTTEEEHGPACSSLHLDDGPCRIARGNHPRRDHLTDSERDYDAWRDLLYGKGPLVLHAIRGELARFAGDEKEGDRLFFTWIRSYVKNFTYKPAETRHLVAILNQITRKDWQPWFERFVYGTETPEVK